MRKSVRALVAASILAFAGAAAEAATFNFMTETRPSDSYFEMSHGDLTMKVSGGWYHSDNETTVKTNAGHGLSVGQHYINGYLSRTRRHADGEYAQFQFNKKVELKGFWANYVSRRDDYAIYADVHGEMTRIQTGDLGYYNGVSDSVSSHTFWIGVRDTGDSFKIKGLHAHVSEVPLPAGAVLLLSGLGLLGLRRRKS